MMNLIMIDYDNLTIEKKCMGFGFCEQICLRNCFILDKNQHLIKISRDDQCVQCGACIVQCSFDALSFKTSKGENISPEIIRIERKKSYQITYNVEHFASDKCKPPKYE